MIAQISDAIGYLAAAVDNINAATAQIQHACDVLAGMAGEGAKVEPFWVAWPIEATERTRITDNFDAPRNYANKRHEGIDCDGFVNAENRLAKVLAAQDGVVESVIFRKNGPSYGLHIIIRHPWNNEPDRFRTLYAHLSQCDVQAGQIVKRGQVIGTAGNSGTTAVHLHFNVHDT